MTVDAGNVPQYPFGALSRESEWMLAPHVGGALDAVVTDETVNPSLPQVASPEVELLNGVHDPIPEGADYTGKIEKESTLHNARVLVANIYEAWGYVNPEDRTPEGYINETLDPHVKDSDYFARIRNKQIVATARLIKKGDISEFPALAEFNIDSSLLSDIDPDPAHFREVSALAKLPKEGHRTDIMTLYANMMKDTVESGGRYWLMSADTRLAGKLRQIFGHKSFTSLGEPRHMMGSLTEPLLLDTQKALQLVGKKFLPRDIKNAIREGLQGIDPTNLDPKTRRVLEKQGIVKPEGEPLKRVFTAKRLATAGLVAYTFARAGVIPATSLDQDGVNPAIFLALDVGTIPPYVEGLARFGDKDGSKVRRLGGLGIAAASFAAPYVYAAAEAPDSASLPEAFGAFGLMLGGYMGIKKAVSMIRNRRNPSSPQPE